MPREGVGMGVGVMCQHLGGSRRPQVIKAAVVCHVCECVRRFRWVIRGVGRESRDLDWESLVFPRGLS